MKLPKLSFGKKLEEAQLTPEKNLESKQLAARRIPTLLGLGVLVIGLIVGSVFISSGAGIFAPRASAEETPQNMKVTNISDDSFTVTFFTAAQTSGGVKYGTEQDSIRSSISDDRDQLSGTIGSYNTHHITVRGLQANTTYYFYLETGGGEFKDDGEVYSVRTAAQGGTPGKAQTIYGSVAGANGGPASGYLVFVSAPGMKELSAYVKDSGSWVIPLSDARTADGSGYANLQEADEITMIVQGTQENIVGKTTLVVGESKPVPEISFSGGTMSIGETITGESIGLSSGQSLNAKDPFTEIEKKETSETQLKKTSTPSSTSDSVADSTSDASGSSVLTGSARLSQLLEQVDEQETVATSEVDMAYIEQMEAESGEKSQVVVNTTQPVIKGSALPNIEVSIEVNSETQIVQTLTADTDGNFVLDLASLGENLEPGNHSVTFSYTDPISGETVTKTQTFVVEDSTATGGFTETQQAYSSGNPVSSPSPSATASATASASPASSASAVATGSATRSSVPATNAAVPVSGSFGTTATLLVGGFFFIVTGIWSFWMAGQVENEIG